MEAQKNKENLSENSFHYKHDEKNENLIIDSIKSENKILSSDNTSENKIIIDENKIPVDANPSMDMSEAAFKNINIISNSEEYDDNINTSSFKNVIIGKEKNGYLNEIGVEAGIKTKADGDPEIRETFESFEADLREFNSLLDENPMYSENDKLVRQLEFYKAYEKKIENEYIKRKYATEGMKLSSFRQKIATLEAARKSAMGKNQAMKQAMERGDADEEVERRYNSQNSTVIKKNILALDGSEETVNNWKADDTLDAKQIAAVREIDIYMLGQATNEYKDKIFMQQVLGCTVRQRLAMYYCIEHGVEKMDDRWLLFSQTQYLPQLSAIKSEMRGWSPLRSLGWKRGHWSKMRRAYEYVMANRDFMDDMAEASLKEDVKNELQNINVKDEDNDLLNNAFVQDDDGQQIVLKPEEQVDLHSKVLALSKEIMKAAHDKGLNKVDSKQWKELSDLVEKEVKAASKTEKTKWKNYKKVIDSTWYYSQIRSAAGVVESSLRIPKVLSETGSKIFDGISTVDIYAAPLLSLGNAVASLGDMVKNWSISSASANVKDGLKATGGINSLITSSAALYDMCANYGYGISSFTERRLDFAKDIAENIEKNGTVATFGANVFLTTTQVVGSAVTVGTSLIDFRNSYELVSKSSDIRKLFKKRKHANAGDEEFAEYKKANHRHAIANLAERIAGRKIASSISNIICDGAGYIKYLVGLAPIGGIVSIGTFAVKTIMTGVDKLLKRRSDYKTVDDFLDLDGQIRECKGANKVDSKFRDRFRKRAMLQLGFANTKTFFAHVASRLGDIIHTTIKNKGEGMKQFVPMLRAMGLNVDLTNNKIPTAKQIAGKLAQ